MAGKRIGRKEQTGIFLGRTELKILAFGYTQHCSPNPSKEQVSAVAFV